MGPFRDPWLSGFKELLFETRRPPAENTLDAARRRWPSSCQDAVQADLLYGCSDLPADGLAGPGETMVEAVCF